MPCFNNFSSHELFNHPFFLVAKLGHDVFGYANVLLQKDGRVSLSLLKIMVPVLHAGSLKQSHIADIHGHSKTAISKQLNTLISLGYISKKTGADKRESIIELTNEGVIETKKGLDILFPIVKKSFSILTTKEVYQLEQILQKLITN